MSETERILKSLNCSMIVNVSTPSGESDLQFALKVKGIPQYEFVAHRAADLIRRSYSGVIRYDQIPEILSKV